MDINEGHTPREVSRVVTRGSLCIFMELFGVLWMKAVDGYHTASDIVGGCS